MEPTTPAIARLLQHFDHSHLPAHLSAASAPFGDAAQSLVAAAENGAPDVADDARRRLMAHLDTLGDDDEAQEAREKWWLAAGQTDLGRCVRLLLEAKDCAVRSAVTRHRAGSPALETTPLSRQILVVDHPPMPAEPPPEGTRWVWCWSSLIAERRPSGWRWWAIDERVADIVAALQDRLPTQASCHGHRPGELPHVWLDDGRVLAVLPDMETLERVQSQAATEPTAPPLRYPATFHVWYGGQPVGHAYELRQGGQLLERGSGAPGEPAAFMSLAPSMRASGLASCMVTLGPPVEPGTIADPEAYERAKAAGAIEGLTEHDRTDLERLAASLDGFGPKRAPGGFTPPTGPAEPRPAMFADGEGGQIGTTKHWLAVHEIGPDGEVDDRVRIPEAWRDQARALLGQGSILVLVEATAFDPAKMRVMGESAENPHSRG